MEITQTKLSGVLVIKPAVFGDSRGLFKETYNQRRYYEAGIDMPFVQDNYSVSQKKVIRGLHIQVKKPQGKLVWCSEGSVLDVVADINPRSATFGQHICVELSDDNHLQLWVPPGFAHGFCVLSPLAKFQYKCTEFYDPKDESGVVWNDPDLSVKWPIVDPVISKKDSELLTLKDFVSNR
jgi:dTDP-4-dehydrorhamnose 3,5-epimerase